MTIREELEELERRTLSPRACLSAESRGRRRKETFHPLRTAFQRDRDRILHSKSFRRLKHKTQVFLRPFGDHYRTRLTHTLEVSQIARTISKALRLNEDLTEGIALGHDLGHTPFGHAGEKVLQGLSPRGFSHFLQSLRVVDKLEYHGKGLNLTHEVRDGIAKHSKGRGRILDAGQVAMPATLEGQVVRISDVIAYVNHDIDDALRAELFKREDLPEDLVRTFGPYHANRIDTMVEDVVASSLGSGLEKIRMSDSIYAGVIELRDFLYERVYFSAEAEQMTRKVETILRDLYNYVLEHPGDFVKSYPEEDPLEIRALDFIAGMTDQYSLHLYEQLFAAPDWPLF
jgi:dGTPase